ncbi:hypothetical protein Ciccas_009349 [Cichlidogyrus casuarinus]|uniref:Uncharacterized protein n=1 Tax=Cichlidogyrus casuarinus TaxID=1844966 RepID=A0ABD2Q1R3_9PLAT
MIPRTPRSASKKLPFAKNNEFAKINHIGQPKKPVGKETRLNIQAISSLDAELDAINLTSSQINPNSKFTPPDVSLTAILSDLEDVPVEQMDLSQKTRERLTNYKRERAVVLIQKWWRRHHKRRQLAEAALQRLLKEAKKPVQLEPKPRKSKTPEPLVIEDDLDLEDIGSSKETAIHDCASFNTEEFMDISLDEKIENLKISSPQVHLVDQTTKIPRINVDNRTERWVKMVNEVDQLLKSQPDPQAYNLRRHSVFSLDTHLVPRTTPFKCTLLKTKRPLTASSRRPRKLVIKLGIHVKKR